MVAFHMDGGGSFHSLSVSSQLIVLQLDGCFSLELVTTAAEQDMCLAPHNG